MRMGGGDRVISDESYRHPELSLLQSVVFVFSTVLSRDLLRIMQKNKTMVPKNIQISKKLQPRFSCMIY